MGDSRQTWLRSLQTVLAVVLLAGVTAGVFWPWLFTGQSLYWGDIGLYFLPMTAFLRSGLARGIVPLWNPHLLCGEPYLGNPQVWPLYPSTVLLTLLPAGTYLTVDCVAHVFLAGAFFTLYLMYGRLRLGFWPAMMGAATYMLGGSLAAKAQFPNMLQALAYVPLALLCTERLVDRPGFGRAMGLGAVFGLQLMAAHAQVTLLTIYLAVAAGLASWMGRRSDMPIQGYGHATRKSGERPAFWRVAGWAAVAGLVALGLSCGQWLPVAQVMPLVERHSLGLHTANRFYLPFYEWVNFVAPYAYGSPMQGTWRAPGNFWEVSCFVGIIPLGLAVYAVVMRFYAPRRPSSNLTPRPPSLQVGGAGETHPGTFVPPLPATEGVVGTSPAPSLLRRGERMALNSIAGTQALGVEGKSVVLFWVGVFVVSLWLAMGVRAGLYFIAYYTVPGLKDFHDSARLLIGAAVALPYLAAVGLALFQERIGGRGLAWLAAGALTALAVLSLGTFDRNLYPLAPESEIEAMAQSPLAEKLSTDLRLADGQGRVFMADPYKTWLYFTAYRDYRTRDPEYLRHWADTLTPNIAMTFGLDQAGGYEPERLDSSGRMASAAEQWAAPAGDKRYKPAPSGGLARLLAAMSVRDVVVYRVQDRPNPPGPPSLQVGGREISFVALRLVARSRWSERGNKVWIYRNDGWLPRARLYARWRQAGGAYRGVGSCAPAHMAEEGPDAVRVTAGRLSAPRLLVLADTPCPGWGASVDGKPADVVDVEGRFRGVVLPAGRASHAVLFSYRPESFALGLYVSLLTCALFAGAIAAAIAGIGRFRV